MRTTRKGWHVVRHMLPNEMTQNMVAWRWEKIRPRYEVIEALHSAKTRIFRDYERSLHEDAILTLDFDGKRVAP